MGHDIFAKVGKEEVSYLRRNYIAGDRKDIYIALDSEDRYAGCSGDGTSKTFSRKQIEDALLKAKDSGMAQDIISFLSEASRHENVIVDFF